MHILLTGGAGFIGSHTARALLARGDSVIIVDNFNTYYTPAIKHRNADELIAHKNCILCEGDIRDIDFLRTVFNENKIDVVCHLAARAGVRSSIQDPFLYEQVNVLGTTHLLQLSIEHDISNFVYASSSSVYGNMPDAPFREDMQLDKPVSPYAATKKACELMAYTYHHLYGLPCTGLRFFTVYGPAGRPDMAPFIFTRAIIKGEPITRFGDGSTQRDYTYIDDIVSGVIASIDTPHPYEIFNLGNGRPIYLRDFIRLIEETVGITAQIEEAPMQPGDVVMTCADISKAAEKLHYSPSTPLEKGIPVFVDWYRECGHLYDV